MSNCPKCHAEVGLKSWLPGKWHRISCPSCGIHLKPSRLIGTLGFLIGPGVALLIGLPLLTGGHPVWGTLICIFAPATGMWIITDHNKFQIIETENRENSIKQR